MRLGQKEGRGNLMLMTLIDTHYCYSTMYYYLKESSLRNAEHSFHYQLQIAPFGIKYNPTFQVPRNLGKNNLTSKSIDKRTF